MKVYLWILIIIGIAGIWGLISLIIEAFSNSKKYLKLKPKLDNFERSKSEHKAKLEFIVKQKGEEHKFKVDEDREKWKLRARKWNKKVQQDKEEILKIAKQKSMGFPWLAKAYADYYSLKDLKKNI